MKSIYNYYDYRLFLKDFYQEKKEELPYFSYRYISHKVKMDSSYVIKVMQGQLHISPKKIEAFIALCNLNQRESTYFETLVYFNRAKTDREKKLYFEKLLNYYRSSQKKIEKKQYHFFQKWYYSATWSLLNFYSFNGNYSELAQMHAPAISVKEAKESITLLIDLGLVEKNLDGKYKVTDQNITTGGEWNSFAITQYQKEMIQKAGESLERFPKKIRNISTLTMNVPDDMLNIVEDFTGNFRKSLIQLANSCQDTDKDNRVFQLNIQLFPLSERN